MQVVGFIIRIHHDARSHEGQISSGLFWVQGVVLDVVLTIDK